MTPLDRVMSCVLDTPCRRGRERNSALRRRRADRSARIGVIGRRALESLACAGRPGDRAASDRTEPLRGWSIGDKLLWTHHFLEQEIRSDDSI
jgi:hypothetical protein